jgi:hypothetical protein
MTNSTSSSASNISDKVLFAASPPDVYQDGIGGT